MLDQPNYPPAESDGPISTAPDPHDALLALRASAEKHRHLVKQVVAQQSPEETQRLVQELQVHQIELEMQYEELLLTQAEVQKAQVRYVDLYDFAPIGYFTLTAAGLIEQLNLRGSQQLGAVRQRLVGRRFALFVASHQRLEFGQFLARVISSDTTQSHELVLQREDGSPFYAQLEGLAVGGSSEGNGPHGQCRLAVIDTTLRRQATDALAASEARFRKLFAESHDAVVLLQGPTCVDCNNAALRLLGATRKEQVVGHHAWAHAPHVQPDGRRTSDLFLKTSEAAVQAGSQRYEARMRKVTGEEVWVEAVLTPIELAGDQPLMHALWRDVTAERLAADRLRESEAQLSLALESSQTGIFSLDLATRQLRWNERAQAVFGRFYDPRPASAEELFSSLHPDDRSRVWGTAQQALASGALLAVDYRVVWPDKSLHHVSAAGRTVTDGQGQVQAFAGVLRDVTDLYAAEAELHYKTLVLERLLRNMPMVLTRFRPDGHYLESVGAGLKALGLEDNALVGRNAFEEFPAAQGPLRKVLTGGQARFLTEREVEGQPVTFQNYGFFDEQRQQAVVLSVDVTEAEQQQKQLRAEKDFTQSLLENTVDGIVAIDRDGAVTAWNSQAAHYFGHGAAAARGRSLFELIPSLSCDEARAVVGRVLAGEAGPLAGPAFEHGAGRYDVYHVPLRQRDETTGVLVIFRDVTERDRLAEEATRLRLRQQQAVLSAILTTQETERKRIAEALHNGLGQLLYAAKLSLEGRPGAPASPDASLKLLHEAIHTTRTISFELTPGILEDFGLRTALEALIKRIAPSGLPVHLHFTGLPGRLPGPIEIAVYRIVQELLNNAMKHAQATEVVVHVAFENGRIDVTVEDNGRGFDPAALAAGPLAGIGLAGVRNRVALLGGELSVNSRLGRGTIISFELVADAVE